MVCRSGLCRSQCVFFFKQKTAYDMRISAWSSDVCSSDLRFLHIGLEMAPEDDVIAWAEGLLRKYPGLPTIISIHDHLNVAGERKAIPAVDFDAVHAEHNDPEELWQKLILPNDQIFMVLSGHQHGQSRRIDKNAAGHMVYQILADYQDRRQALAMLAPDEIGRAHV